MHASHHVSDQVKCPYCDVLYKKWTLKRFFPTNFFSFAVNRETSRQYWTSISLNLQ